MADKQQYFSILTDIGRYKIAKAAADKGEIKFKDFAIGDGGGQETSPTPGQKALVREVWRTQIDAADIDPANPAAVIIVATIPRTEGGWWMREFGLFDADGDMLAVIKPAPNYKATMAEGQNEDIVYQFQLIVGENANVVVVIDPSSQYLTKEAADKFYPSREEVDKKIGDKMETGTKDFVKKPELKAAIAGVKVLNQPWLAVLAIDLKTPPASPNMGDVYLVAAAAAGEWKGKDGQIAEWRGDPDKWRFTQPLNGHGIGLPNGDVYVRQSGAYKQMTSNLLDLKDIDNAAKAKPRAILTRSAKGGTFLTPEEAFKGVHLPYPDIDDFPVERLLPAGAVMAFAMPSAPKGWLKCNGAWIGRKEYPELYAAIGDTWGVDDKGIAFRLPDLRGEFIRGWIDDRDPATLPDTQKGRPFAGWQRSSLEKHQHQGTADWSGEHQHQMGHDYATYDGRGWAKQWVDGGSSLPWTTKNGNHTHTFTTNWGNPDDGRFASETAPQNFAVLYCIKI